MFTRPVRVTIAAGRLGPRRLLGQLLYAGGHDGGDGIILLLDLPNGKVDFLAALGPSLLEVDGASRHGTAVLCLIDLATQNLRRRGGLDVKDGRVERRLAGEGDHDIDLGPCLGGSSADRDQQ
ncbi:hypothetical protein CSOJ01_04458 [Colletotrichum sojae]|uniref:Uncharacterized protein n=1 Tax=Colletotrichum sojae TaxID=2175907 RepID=A0A8H6JIE8_9PEZI|nr:hypothetical protein CSOJ01_04458 [Colletotrichum sojae]